MPVLESGAPDLPRVARLPTYDTKDFPAIERVVPGYGVALKLPYRLRRLFESGVAAVCIDSLELARYLPDFGGKSSGTMGVLHLHQDNFGDLEDMKRFLLLANIDDAPRGAPTLIARPDAARLILPTEYEAFKTLRTTLGKERAYDGRFKISERQYDRCFDTEHGFDDLVAELLGQHDIDAYRLKLNVLVYLMRGPTAETIMRQILERYGHFLYAETWETTKVCIIDNTKVFHAKGIGVSDYLKRLFCTLY